MQDILHQRARIWAGLTLAGLALCTPAVEAGQRLSFPWLRDMQVTLYARRALAQDPVLGPLNLGVKVHDGIATVWGPIPNDALGLQAVKRVEAVQGILQVRSDLYVLGPKKQDELPEVPLVFDEPVKTESASPDRNSGKIDHLTGRLGPGFPAEPPTTGLHAAVSLLPPVAGASGAVPVPASVSAGDALTAAINRLRLGDERYHAIALELKDGAVLLRGGGSPGEHVMAFAQAVSELPGVARVVVLNYGQ